MEKRIDIINKLWKEIHGDYDTIFYWTDGSETSYYYDEISDCIKSENGFYIPVEKDTVDLTKDYIFNLIDKLESIIILYYRHILKHELLSYD